VNHRDLTRAAGKTAAVAAAIALLGVLTMPFAPSCLPGGDPDSVLLAAGVGACVGDRSVVFVVASTGFLVAFTTGVVAVGASLYDRIATPP
jgi:hypothetical protein